MAQTRLLGRALLGLLWLGTVGCGTSAPAPAVPPPTGASAASSAAVSAPAGAPSAAAGALAGAPDVVHVGVLQITVEAGLYIALQRGYFAEVGLAPELISFDSGTRALPALAAGHADATSGGFSPAFVNAIQRGVDVKMVASMASNEVDANSSFLILRKDLFDSGQVRDYADLRGRSIAIPPGMRPGLGEYMMARAIGRGGLTLNDVELMPLPFGDMVPALGNRTIDAAHVSEPLSTVAVDRGIGVKWKAASDYLPGVTPTMLTYGPGLLDKAPDTGQRLMLAYLRGARDYNNAFKYGIGRPEIVQILTEYTTVKVPALYDRMGMSYIPPDGTINIASLADQLAYYVETGGLPDGTSLATLIDDRFREAAVQRLGPYQAP
jgi:NitT/TauT family transport system substrate-binding protein